MLKKQPITQEGEEPVKKTSPSPDSEYDLLSLVPDRAAVLSLPEIPKKNILANRFLYGLQHSKIQ